jgi:hypothetical protein
MRTLAVWTTTAAVALMGAATAQAQTPAPSDEGASSGDFRAAVTAYASYHNDVADLRANPPGDANGLENALDRVARHNRDAITRGWIAYGAQVAAQSPEFIEGVRNAAAFYGRDAVIWAVSVDPSYARGLRGGNDATRLLLDSARADSARILAVADRYQELAYSIQRQSWANRVAPRQADRLQRIRGLGAPGGYTPTISSEISPRLSVAPLSISPGTDPTAFGGRRFWDALRGGGDVVEVASAPVSYQWRVNGPRGGALDRMAAVAALQALDAADSNQTAVMRLINDPRSRDCFEMAQLQLYQCMSAARFRYENAFCLGQHGLRDVGTCIGAVAEEPVAATPAPTGGATTRE